MTGYTGDDLSHINRCNRKTTYRDPVAPIEFPADDNPIFPCDDCHPWHVDIVIDHPCGGVWAREWHAVGCSKLQEWLDPSEGVE